MLHTLNSGWAKILLNQNLKDQSKLFLFVTDGSPREMGEIYKAMNETNNFSGVFVISIDNMTDIMKRVKAGQGEMPMFDDILISHELYDIFLKDFLSRHCKRKGA